jgi:hypothetical protein
MVRDFRVSLWAMRFAANGRRPVAYCRHERNVDATAIPGGGSSCVYRRNNCAAAKRTIYRN